MQRVRRKKMTTINIIEDVQPLTTFRKKAAETLKKITETKRPAFLTVNGKIEAVLQDAHSYQELKEQIEDLEERIQILQGLAEAERAKGTDAKAFFEELGMTLNEKI